MIESILDSVKSVLGIDAADSGFDQSLLIFINSVMFDLREMGVGPTSGFMVTGRTETWTNFIGTSPLIGVLPGFVGLKVRLLFDPPTTSYLNDNITKQLDQMAYRLVNSSTQSTPTP